MNMQVIGFLERAVFCCMVEGAWLDLAQGGGLDVGQAELEALDDDVMVSQPSVLIWILCSRGWLAVP
jgi:hypothetical protein